MRPAADGAEARSAAPVAMRNRGGKKERQPSAAALPREKREGKTNSRAAPVNAAQERTKRLDAAPEKRLRIIFSAGQNGPDGSKVRPAKCGVPRRVARKSPPADRGR